MKALIQKLTTTSSGWASTLAATQHWTSLGPGQRRVTKVPEQADPGLLRQLPAVPLTLVHDLLMQHLTSTGSSGQ